MAARSRQLRAIAFDLDGTLIDSRRDLATAVNRMRGELGMDALTIPEVVGMIGEGARNLVRRALGGTPEERDLDEALAIFYGHYENVCTDATRAFPGIEALLDSLRTRLPLAVLTNKPERFARKILATLGLAESFREVLGGDTLATRKPDPAGLATIAGRLGVAPAELLLVGDSHVDAATAAAAGAPLVLVAWGFARPAERDALAGERWIGEPRELLDLLEA